MTDLQFLILEGMADDFEDLEQLYLHANRDLEKEQSAQFAMPDVVLNIRFPLRDIIDEVALLIGNGVIEAKASADEAEAPLKPVNVSKLHYYWFGMTKQGERAWLESRRQR